MRSTIIYRHVARTVVRNATIAALLLGSAAISCMAAERDLSRKWALGVHFENDLFADTDSQYTNGIKVTAVSPDLTS